MITAPVYLLNRAFYRLKEFFRHWYVRSFYIYSHFVLSQLERIDRVLAFKITLRNIFHPLYQDRTILGYILGFIFRALRLATGVVVYAVVIAAAAFFYLIWLAIPIYAFYKIIS